MIQKPYTIAEIKAKVASNDYSAELMLQHAMLHLDALAAQPAAEPAGLPIEQEPKYTVDGSHIVNRASGEAIPHDEPVFIFRARDVHAREALEAYACVLTPGEHRDAVVQRVADFAAFAQHHPDRMKEPDTHAVAAQPARAGGDARMADRVAELEDVLRSVDEQFRVYGDRLPDGFDSRVFRWVKDALAAAPQPAPAVSAGDPAHALLRSDQCDQAYLRDFVPYKGNPDPLRVWRTAWNSCCAAWMSQPAPAEPVLDAKNLLPDPLGCRACTHPDCGRYHGPRSVECSAIAFNACARPVRGEQPAPAEQTSTAAVRGKLDAVRQCLKDGDAMGASLALVEVERVLDGLLLQPAGGAVPAVVTDKMLALARRIWTIVEEANNSTIAWHGNQIGAFAKAKEAHDEKWTAEIARVLASAAPAAVERDASMAEYLQRGQQMRNMPVKELTDDDIERHLTEMLAKRDFPVAEGATYWITPAEIRELFARAHGIGIGSSKEGGDAA